MSEADYVNIGSTPPEEDCEQAGPNYDPDKSRRECRAYIALLRRDLIAKGHGEQLMKLEENGEFRLFIKSNPHDFGTYHEVEAKVRSEEAYDLALVIEGDGPMTWDVEARKELGLAEA